MISTVSKSGVDYDYPEGGWGMERWHEIAEENKAHLTNASLFRAEEVHPNDMAGDAEKRRREQDAAARAGRLRRLLAEGQDGGWGGRAVSAARTAWRWLVG
jgi:hypothetical protein